MQNKFKRDIIKQSVDSLSTVKKGTYQDLGKKQHLQWLREHGCKKKKKKRRICRNTYIYYIDSIQEELYQNLALQ